MDDAPKDGCWFVYKLDPGDVKEVARSPETCAFDIVFDNTRNTQDEQDLDVFEIKEDGDEIEHEIEAGEKTLLHLKGVSVKIRFGSGTSGRKYEARVSFVSIK